jgi:hypothetical protein
MFDDGLPSASSDADDGSALGAFTRTLTAILTLLVASARGARLIAGTAVGAARVVVGRLSHGALVVGRGAGRAMRSLLSSIRAVVEPLAVAALRGLGAVGRFGALYVRRMIAGLREPLGAARAVTLALFHALVPVGHALRRILAAGWRLVRVVLGGASRAVLAGSQGRVRMGHAAYAACWHLRADTAPGRSSDRGERDRAAGMHLTIQIVALQQCRRPSRGDRFPSRARGRTGSWLAVGGACRRRGGLPPRCRLSSARRRK